MAASRKSTPLRPEPDLLQAVLEALQPFAGQRCVVGLSGGLDSVVLLDLAARVAPQLDILLSAIHVNHQLSPHADAWQQFCLQRASSLGISCQARKVSLQRKGGNSLEAVARDARYAVYRQSDADVILLAHHLDDQCETLLLRLLRGTGIHGLGAMPQTRPLGDTGKIVLRPLLQYRRSELVAYADSRSLTHIHDESNDQLHFRRNWLRHHLLPQLEQTYPGYRQQLQAASQHARESADLLDELAQADCVGDPVAGWLDLQALLHLSPARQRNLLRWFLRHWLLVPSAAELQQLQQQMLHARADAAPQVQLGDYRLRRFQGRMYLQRRLNSPVPCPVITDLQLTSPGIHPLPGWGGALRLTETCGAGVAANWLYGCRLRVGRRNGGERIRPAPGAATRLLKHLLQEAAVPPWLRPGLPLLWLGDQLVIVPGVASAAGFQAGTGEAGVHIEWLPDIRSSA